MLPVWPAEIFLAGPSQINRPVTRLCRTLRLEEGVEELHIYIDGAYTTALALLWRDIAV